VSEKGSDAQMSPEQHAEMQRQLEEDNAITEAEEEATAAEPADGEG
jgi:hypothetical protein